VSDEKREARCYRCKRVFPSFRSLGQHGRQARASAAQGRANRICPDRRDEEEARDTALRIVRLKAKLGLGAFSRARREDKE
jgi:hypothetical protein